MDSAEKTSEMAGSTSYLLEEVSVLADLRNDPLYGLLKEAHLRPWKPCLSPRISEGVIIRSHSWMNGSRSGVFYFPIVPFLMVADPYSGQPGLLQRVTGFNQVGRTYQKSML